MLAQRAAAKVRLFVDPLEPQQRLIDRLHDGGAIGATQRSIFHDLRRSGNAAVHEGKGDHREALHQLRIAWQLAVWFQRSFWQQQEVRSGAVHSAVGAAQRLRQELAGHQQERTAAQAAIEQVRKAAEAELAQRLTAEQLAAKAKEDAAIRKALAEIEAHRKVTESEVQRGAALEQQNRQLQTDLAALQATAQAMPPRERAEVLQQAAQASDEIELDKAATREIIDRQLRDAGYTQLKITSKDYARGAKRWMARSSPPRFGASSCLKGRVTSPPTSRLLDSRAMLPA